MTTQFMVISFLVIHFLICLTIEILIKADVSKISNQMFFLVLFLPVSGAVMALTADRLLKKNKTGSKAIQIKKIGLSDTEYKAITMTFEERENTVVPLEEAILINDQETRRQLMIDVLQQDTKQYIHLLQKARENDDIEVTHYASTAIMEMQREYELKIKRCENEYLESPEDIEKLDTYIHAICDYINSSLVQDSLLYMQRQKLDAALTKRLAMNNPSPDMYLETINNLLEMSVFQKAEFLIENALQMWPKNENLWLMKLKYSHLMSDGDMIKKTIEDMKNSGLYLSAETKKKIAFWS